MSVSTIKPPLVGHALKSVGHPRRRFPLPQKKETVLRHAPSQALQRRFSGWLVERHENIPAQNHIEPSERVGVIEQIESLELHR